MFNKTTKLITNSNANEQFQFHFFNHDESTNLTNTSSFNYSNICIDRNRCLLVCFSETLSSSSKPVANEKFNVCSYKTSESSSDEDDIGKPLSSEE